MSDIRTMLDALGLPHVIPEPEVTQAALARIRCKSLAGLIVDLLNESEPLLKASADDATVTVRERGGSAVMRFTISEGVRP